MDPKAAPAPCASFLDWWFAPWRYAHRPQPPLCQGLLAQRDAYRDWCRVAGVAADLPASGDLRWQMTIRDREEFNHAVTLYGGLFAARQRDQAELACLTLPQRRWCLSVALTQPLQPWSGPLPEELRAIGVRARGMAELALRLERAFPGLWSRLRLLLPEHEAHQMAQVLTPALSASASASALSSLPRERERNCWQLCLAQARAGASSTQALLRA